jgi:two-component system nitrogen regulation response regulator NtrX
MSSNEMMAVWMMCFNKDMIKDLGMDKADISSESRELLESYPWPGNVRELRNLAERISVIHRGGPIQADEIKDLLKKTPGAFTAFSKHTAETGDKNAAGSLLADSPVEKSAENSPPVFPAGITGMNLNDARDAFEKFFLEFHLSKNSGIIARTAEAIGIYPSNLHAKLRKYHIISPKPENGGGFEKEEQ